MNQIEGTVLENKAILIATIRKGKQKKQIQFNVDLSNTKMREIRKTIQAILKRQPKLKEMEKPKEPTQKVHSPTERSLS